MKLGLAGIHSLTGETMREMVLKSQPWKRYHWVLASSHDFYDSYMDDYRIYRDADPLFPNPAERFKDCSIVFLCLDASISRIVTPLLLACGCVVIDLSSAYRLSPEVPLVIPEINSREIFQHQGIIANPNCTTTILLMAIYPIYRAAGLKRLFVASYQSVSGAGSKATRQLNCEYERLFLEDSEKVYPEGILFNLIPVIGELDEEGFSEEERKVKLETKKILGLPDLEVRATCVRVPVWYSHGLAVTVETEHPVPLNELKASYAGFPGVRLMEKYVTPQQAWRKNEVFVSRLRQESPTEFSLWAIGDNLRKGAGWNALQIAELLIPTLPPHPSQRLSIPAR